MLALGLGVTSSLTSIDGLVRGPYSEGGLFPRLVLDFDDNKYVTDVGSVTFADAFTAASPKLTYTCASTSTMVNSSGNIVSVAAGTPRVGHHVYSGSAWVNEGLLIESEARTNLVTYSEDFANAAWLKTDATISGTLTSSPDGQTNGRTVTFAGTNDLLRFIGPSCSVGESYTASIWAKAGTSSSVKFSVLFSGSGLGSVEETITLTSEWQRFTISGTVPSGTPDTARMRFTSLEAGSIQVFGAQLEENSTASSYIPTSGATVTRAAQTLAVPPAAFGWNNSAVSIQMDGRMTYANEGVTTTARFTSWNAGGGVYIEQRLDTASTDTGRVSFAQQTGGVYDSKSVNIYSPGTLVRFNIASRHGSTYINGAVDGVALTADTTPTALPDLSGTNIEIAHDFMGTIRTFRQFAGDIGDAGLVTATS